MASEVKQIRCAEDAYELLRTYLDEVDREHFVVMVLDNKHRVRGIHQQALAVSMLPLFIRGRLSKLQYSAKPAESSLHTITQAAIRHQSREDIAVTCRLRDACKLMGIDLLDHIVNGEEKFVSLKAKRHM